MFGSVLIANRGEIALRVARTCRELGIKSIAVYSAADEDSAVVRFADEAVRIGPAAAKASYLYIPAVIEAALKTGAEAVHPGYGFLSEEPDFAEVCASYGLTLIGPPAEVIRKLGDKVEARTLMAATGMPLLPGSLEPVAAADEARRIADQIGYPVILKAAAGGGGKGMQVVSEPGEFAWKYGETTRTALALFGDARVYLERYLNPARHVEIQVLCDAHGNGVHLGERDCSVQRRHQKLVEETPAPGLDPALLAEMGRVAVRSALAAGYVGAGTFEFLVGADGTFSFMEVNSRIQVEHPVTEMATGLDLVREQIRVAAGLPLGFAQRDVVRRGCAIECRINAENPARGFVPAPGVLAEFVPAGGPFVRVDTHGYAGYRVPGAYDSLLAKLVVWAPDREQALARMRRALDEFRVSGPGLSTTTGFLRSLLDHPAFCSATHSTSLVDEIQSAPQAV
ncbi:acetyl-CoA carboxylase biotin carboxylase subunit [Amycolatopsis circi]|uniref:acetyl-CoA carboxylase biotin carboxylase subunit n=1 Tax=Amycolatopsis circi TaxID=871959 RepID=UPI000E2207A8|nr:acetyl-CoA carboxylase biotin carboxylase subunit [Amycolatopsis circi]